MRAFRLFHMALLLWLSGQAQHAYAWRMESGVFTTNDTSVSTTFTSVTFQETFDVVPVVVVLASDQGAEPAMLRIKNVTVNGFLVAAFEPTNSDGDNPGMTAHYMAIEPGQHVMADGTKLAAGTHPTSTMFGKFVTSGWDTVSFGSTLDAAASVVATIQTMNSSLAAAPGTPLVPFMSAATLNPSASSIQLTLDRAETSTGTVVSEDIGWIAFPSGEGGSFLDTSDVTIGWDARFTTDNIVGLDNGCRTYTFSGTGWANARVLASKNTRDGVDGGWLRRCSLSGTTIGLVIDEDTTNDPERRHTTERAALVAFSDSFHVNFKGKILADKTLALSSGSYALPGNTVTYTISAQSTGILPIDTGAVIIVDNLPSELAFRVVDIDAPGGGPIKFDNGSPASGLTYTYVALGDTGDDLEFSNNGGASFGYTPVDDGTGADPDVTHIRINPKGAFSARSAVGIPDFSITYDANIE